MVLVLMFFNILQCESSFCDNDNSCYLLEHVDQVTMNNLIIGNLDNLWKDSNNN